MANPKISSIPLSEKEITDQVKSFLEAKNWLYIRLQSGLLRTPDSRFIRTGAKGMPDAVALHGLKLPGSDKPTPYSKTLFLEFKNSKGGKLSPDQLKWHENARRNRLVVLVVNSFHQFQMDYEELFGTIQ